MDLLEHGLAEASGAAAGGIAFQAGHRRAGICCGTFAGVSKHGQAFPLKLEASDSDNPLIMWWA